ncbi:hypothetical protein DRN97_04375 [Methanosarcinales archaeon]|nr:MAG: hypothetical protein DRN97_04375 [Methanosarcinales archaeon]
MKTKCDYCGKEIDIKPYRLKRSKHLFCSRRCQGKWRSENIRGSSAYNWRGGPITLICSGCGKEFKRERDRLKKANNYYCSKKCFNEHRKKENHPNWQGGNVIRQCKYCGKEFITKRRGKSTAIFCSSECHVKWIRQKHLGTHKPKKIKPEEHQNIIDKYLKRISPERIATYYGVTPGAIYWILKKHNIKLWDTSQYPKLQEADDGHLVRSSLERMVDNYLFHNKIPHIYNPQIPFSNYRADFLVGNQYIEIWGMIGNKEYDERMQDKLKHYQEYGLPLIQIFPEDIPHNLDRIFAKIFDTSQKTLEVWE